MSAPDAVPLPVEVIGPDGHTERVVVDVPEPAGVDSLYLKAYSIGYPRHVIEDRGYTVAKASIRLNDGPWVDVTNETVQCKYPEREMLCVTGPMHTIRLEMPLSALGPLSDAGRNTIDFRFNFPEAGERNADAPGDASTGYRILDLELRDASDADRIAAPSFAWDDPSTWTAPAGYDTPSDVSRGEQLWHARNTLDDYWNGPPIVASCADCHADDGRDLEYFAFSNASIVARSQYHGLSEHQGKQIAAYIRSLVLRDPDTGQAYDPPGRPWHPPYQPGPTAVATRSEDAPRTSGQPFHAINSQHWAAGAGLSWVLDHDREMLPHLFPGGVSLDDVHPDSSLNVREVPIALQYPDWNEWLPEHHPLDLWGDAFATWTRSNGDPGPWQRYQDESMTSWSFQAVRNCMDASGNDAAACKNPIWRSQASFAKLTYQFRNDRVSLLPQASVPRYEADYSLKRWQAVKQWELIHSYDLMDESRVVFNNDAPALGWPNKERDVFNHASHILSHSLKGDEYGVHDPYFDTAWYDLQIVLNSGQGRTTGQSPVDWKYHFPHIYERSEITAWPQALRYIRSFVRLLQNANLPNANQARGDRFPEGWYLRHTQLGWLDRFPSDQLNAYRAGLKEQVLTEVTRSWIQGAVVGNDWSSFCRDGGQWCIEPESTDPNRIRTWGPSEESHYANSTFTMVIALRDAGVAPSVVDSLRDWGASLWPNATDPTWASLLPESTSHTLRLRPGWNFVSSYVAPSNPSLPAVFAGTGPPTMVMDGAGRTYLPAEGVNTVGPWRTGQGYKVHVGTETVLTLTGPPVEPDAPLDLEAGWNLIPYYPRAGMDAATAFAPIQDRVLRVEDQDGRVYVPGGTNAIGDLVPGRAYAVFVTVPTSFTYPTTSGGGG